MLLLIAARLHFVFVNHPPWCQTAGSVNITKRIKAGRPVMTRLAVCFTSEWCVLISPPTTFHSVKAVGYLRLHSTLTVGRRYTALLTVAYTQEVVSCVLAQDDCSVSCYVSIVAIERPKVKDIGG